MVTSSRVGGVVSETSFKFFIQFMFYALLFAVYNLVVMAVFTAQLRRHVSPLYSSSWRRVSRKLLIRFITQGNVNIHYILILAL